MVVPPNAAEVVALSNVSAFTMPAAESCSIWQWLSTPPGSTSLPRASISRPAGPSPRPIATMRLAGDRDIGLENVGRGGDAASADDQVVGGLGHCSLLGDSSGKWDRAGA